MYLFWRWTITQACSRHLSKPIINKHMLTQHQTAAPLFTRALRGPFRYSRWGHRYSNWTLQCYLGDRSSVICSIIRMTSASVCACRLTQQLEEHPLYVSLLCNHHYVSHIQNVIFIAVRAFPEEVGWISILQRYLSLSLTVMSLSFLQEMQRGCRNTNGTRPKSLSRAAAIRCLLSVWVSVTLDQKQCHSGETRLRTLHSLI